MERLNSRLEALATIPAAELRTEWEQAHKEAAPCLPVDLLRLAIAYRWQEKVKGGLPRSAAGALRSGGSNPSRAGLTKPGTRLVRSWNGRTISVQVNEDGFLFEDRTYRSLSAIAREVTRTAWSGPRFFGLNGSARHG